MRIAILVLLVSTSAFAATSVYFRQSALRVDAERTELAARVTQLEQKRAALETEVQSLRANEEPSPPPAAPVTAEAPKTSPPPVARQRARGFAAVAGASPAGVFQTFRTGPPLPQTPTMRKVMRNQLRQHLARTYEDADTELGLTAEESRKLIDLLADQQSQWHVESMPSEPVDPEAVRRKMEETQRKQQADLAALLGPEKMALFAEYQKTLPARSELLQLQEQFVAAEVPLREDQRRQLLRELVETQDSRPELRAGMTPEEVGAAVNGWEEDKHSRLASSAQAVLSPAQMEILREYQQYQRDIREHFRLVMPPPTDPANGQPLNAVAVGPTVTYSAPFGTATPTKPSE